jgi:GAF domain-containing protein
LATQAAIAYDHARQMQELKQLQQVMNAMSSAGDLHQVQQIIVAEAKKLFQAQAAVVWAYDPELNRFISNGVVANGLAETLVGELRKLEPEPGSLTTRIINEGQLIIRDLAAPEVTPPLRELLRQFGVHSFLGVKLKVGERAVGILYLCQAQARTYSAEDLQRLENFATAAALALRKARLVEQVRNIKRLAGAVASVTTLGKWEETLQLIADETLEAIGCDAVTLYAYDQTADKLDYPPKTAGLFHPEMTGKLPTMLSDSIVYRMLQRDEMCVVERAETHELFNYRRFTHEEQIKSLVAVPLLVAGRRTGVIFFNYRKEHHFTDDDLDNIRLFADLAAVAIHNAQLFAEKTAMHSKVVARNAVACMGMESAQARHVINSRVANIINNAQLIRTLAQKSGGEKTVPEWLMPYLREIEEEALLIGCMPITPPLSGENGVQAVKAHDLLRDRLADARKQNGCNGIRFSEAYHSGDEPVIRISPEWLRHAFDILVENAIKAVAGQIARRQEIVVTTRVAGQYLEIAITDRGNGIPPGVLQQLFQQKVDHPAKHKGLGMGLLMAQIIAETYGGTVCVGATGADGTEMILSLPLALALSPAVASQPRSVEGEGDTRTNRDHAVRGQP